MQAIPYGQGLNGQLPQTFTPHHDLSVPQLSRRSSRGSSNHRGPNPMRVMKPTSASNSPQSTMGGYRRRTLVNDVTNSRRTQQVLEQLLVSGGMEESSQPAARPSRPVSWHPGSYLQQLGSSATLSGDASQYYHTPSVTACRQQAFFPSPHQLSPPMASYSTDTSPTSAFSSLPISYDNFASQGTQYYSPEDWHTVQKMTPFYPTPSEPRDFSEPFPSFGTDAHQQGMDWQSYIGHGGNATTPPTPDSLLQPDSGLATLPHEDLSFHALDEPEEEGEILVGMGLYDAPEKVDEDPQLDSYRNTVSTLLGSRFRPSEPQGKGLKLEETWAPPPKSDEDEDEDEEEE